MKNDGTDGRPNRPEESVTDFAPSGSPTHLTDKGRADTGGDFGQDQGVERVDGRPGGAPSAGAALGGYGGLSESRKISSMVGEGAATLPDVPITADPANEGG